VLSRGWGTLDPTWGSGDFDGDGHVDDDDLGLVLANWTGACETIDLVAGPARADLLQADRSNDVYEGSLADSARAGQAGPLGDLDGNFDVDDDDLSLFLSCWADCYEISGSPPVDDDDLSILLANWTGPLDHDPIPEPAALSLLAAGGLVLVRRRRCPRCL
jgi:MYXO-CTERM domain-containing protein